MVRLGVGCTLGGIAYLTPTGRCPLTTSAPRGCLAPTALEAPRATEARGQHEEDPTRALGGECIEQAAWAWDPRKSGPQEDGIGGWPAHGGLNVGGMWEVVGQCSVPAEGEAWAQEGDRAPLCVP